MGYFGSDARYGIVHCPELKQFIRERSNRHRRQEFDIAIERPSAPGLAPRRATLRLETWVEDPFNEDYIQFRGSVSVQGVGHFLPCLFIWRTDTDDTWLMLELDEIK